MEYNGDFSWDQQLVNEHFSNPKIHSQISKQPQNNITDFQKLFNDILNNSKKSNFVASQTNVEPIAPKAQQKNTTDIILTLTQSQIYFILLVIFVIIAVAVCKQFDNLNQKIDALNAKILLNLK